MLNATSFENSLPVVESNPRRLGKQLAAIRKSYLLGMPLLMMACAIVCWAAPVDPVLALGAVALGGVGVYLLFDVVVLQGPLRITTILVMTLALGYGVGTANTYFTVSRGSDTLGDYLHTDPSMLTHSMGSVLFVVSLLLAIGEALEKPILGEDFILQIHGRTVTFITIGTLLIIAAYLHGSLGYMGAAASAEGHVSFFSTLADWLLTPLFSITVVSALNVPSGPRKIYLMCVVGAQFLLQIPIGRRALIYSMVLAMIGLRLGKFRFNWSWTRRIVVAGILTSVVYVSSIGFFYLRLAEYDTKKSLSLVGRVMLAYNYFETKDYATVKESFSKNVETRTFILGFLAELEADSERFPIGMGQDLAEQLAMTIPSALFPDKNVHFVEEGLANSLFGTSFPDQPNSVLTGGVIDFGFIGMVLYPLVFAFMIRGFLEVVGQLVPAFVAVFLVLATLGQVLQPELALENYFLLIRSGILFGSLIWIAMSAPLFRFKRPRL